MNTPQPIEIRPRSSRLLSGLLLGFHLLCVIVVLASVTYKPAAAALILLTLLSWYRAHRQHIQYRGRAAVRRLVWQSDGSWLLDDGQAKQRPAGLLPSTYLHPRLVILNFRLLDSRQRRNVVLLPDSLDPECLRQLRVRLRIEAAAENKPGLRQA